MNSDFAEAEAEAELRPPPIYVAPSTMLRLNNCSQKGGAAATAAVEDDGNCRFPSLSDQSDGDREGVISLAAVEAEGKWFALNGAQLEYCQRLEKEGRCRRVRLEPVPVEQLSDETRTGIAETLDASIKNAAASLNSPVIRGYESLKNEDIMTKSTAAMMSDSMTGAISDLNDSSGAGADDSSSECGSHYLDWSEEAVDSSGGEEEDRPGDNRPQRVVGRKRRTSADGRSATSSDNERLIAAD